MFTYSTCTGCHGLLQVTDDEIAHDGCTEVFTKVQLLAQQWLLAACHGDLAEERRLEIAIEVIDSATPRFKDAALAYAAWGWPVFPLREHEKVPATKHGFKDATTDATRIARWWDRHPNDNVGLPTGLAFDVVDVDAPIGVHSYLALLRAEKADGTGPLPDAHGRVVTASGGFHLYVKPTGAGNRAGWHPGIDIRGRGGYVVAPPSTLGTRNRTWSWSLRPSPVITGG